MCFIIVGELYGFELIVIIEGLLVGLFLSSEEINWELVRC